MHISTKTIKSFIKTMSRMISTSTSNKKSFQQKITKQSAVGQTPYCGACHKAGKPLEEYTSHWTRSTKGTNGDIVCPFILSSECGYCHEMGHWTKFCPVLSERKNTISSPVVKPDATNGKKKNVVVKKENVIKSSMFSEIYMSDSDSEPDSDKKKTSYSLKKVDFSSILLKPNQASLLQSEEFPQLNTNTVSLEKEKEKSEKKVRLHLDWASMMKKTLDKENEDIEMKKPTPIEHVVSFPPFMSTITKVLASSSKPKPKSWADCSDSDEDEDFDEFQVLPTGRIA